MPSGRQRPYWLMLLPFLLGMALLMATPALLTLVLSVHDADLLSTPRLSGLQNYLDLFNDDVFRISLRASVVFILVAVPLRVLIALAIGLLLARPLRGATAYRTAPFVPTIVPEPALALIFLWIFNPLFGPLNGLLQLAGLPAPAWLTTPAGAQAAIVILSLFTIGESLFLVLLARRHISPHLYEIAELEGAGAIARTTHITLPLISPLLLLLAIRDTALSFQLTFVPALLMTGGGPPPYATTYVPLFIYRQGFDYLRFGYASAATVVLLLVAGALIYVQLRIWRRWGTEVEA